MSAAVTRDLKVTYAGTVIGATSDYLVDGPFVLRIGATRGQFECEVLLSQDTEAAFQTAEATLLTAWRTPRQRLRIEVGSAERYDFDPADSTGFDHEPTVEKVANAEATGTSARYRLSVAWGIQGTLVNSDGRVESSTSISVSPSGVRRITFAGVYTAAGANSAYTQYTGNVATWIAAQLAALLPGVTTELLTDESSMTDSGKGCQFSRTYREVIANEAIGTLNVAHLRDQNISIAVSDSGPGDSDTGVRRPTDVLISYDVWVDKAVTTALPALWAGTIYPNITAQAAAAAGTGALTVIESSPVYDKGENRISATLRCQAYAGSVLQLDIEVEDVIDLGLVDVAVWDDVPFSRDVYRGPQSHMRTVYVSRLSRTGGNAATVVGASGVVGSPGVKNLLGVFAIPSGGGGATGHIPSPDHRVTGNFIERQNSRRKKVVVVGFANKVKLIDELEVRVYTRAEKPAA
jgi:hypothetical protein